MAIPRIKKRQEHQQKELRVSFDVGILNSFIKFLFCDFVPRTQIQNLYKLMQMLNVDDYSGTPDIQDRIEILKNITKAKVEEGIIDDDLMYSYLVTNCKNAGVTLNQLNMSHNQLTERETKHVAESIEERMQAIYVYQSDNILIQYFNELRSPNCFSYYEIIDKIRDLLSNLLSKLQPISSSGHLLQRFDFSSDSALDDLDKIVRNAQSPTGILQTGIRQLNALLSPGFQSGRFYVFLGCTGKFKSGTLLNMADQIRRYNPQIDAVENGLRKTILFLTLENSVNETVERLIDMYSGVNDDILDMTVDDIIGILREKGDFVFTDTKGIDIEIQYYGNLELRVNGIPSIIQDMRERGKETIAIVIDYIDRIESNQPNSGDERLRIGYAAANLKTLSYDLNIPIITAMQVNREANAVLDSAMRDNKEDLAQLVGASAVGLCWKLIWEADWACFVYPERQRSTGLLHLSFKLLKRRGKKRDVKALEYFNHPFTNEKEIMLQCDVDKERSISIISLRSDLENADIDAQNAEENFRKRPRLESVSDLQKTQISNALKKIDLGSLSKIS